MVQSITLQNVADAAVVNNDILGQICFAAPNEASGTDSILISASIFARSEGTFASDNNATELVFVTAASESAAPGATNYDMALGSTGTLTLAGGLVIADGGNIGSASDTDALTISSGGLVTFSQGFAVGSDAAGDILYHNGTSYVRLAKGSDDEVLTLASGLPSWAASGSGSGDITEVIAGTLLDGGATSGSATLNVDLSEAAEAALVNGDYILFLDGGATGTAAKESLADLATLFAGDGLAASASVLAVNVDDSTIEINSDSIRIKGDGVGSAQIADDAINSEHYVDGSIDTAHIADNQITLAKMAGLTRGSVIYGNASGDPAYLAVGAANKVLTSDGTDASWGAVTTSMMAGLTRGSLIYGGSSAGSCSNASYTDQSTCEAAEETWTATLAELTIGAANTALTSNGTDASWAKISNAMLTNDSVSYGGVEVDLGASDATPAFNLADATGLPIIAGTTGTLSVARGGTGQTTLNDLITLGTHTTGNYVATLTGGTGITSTGATTGETIAHSISTDASQTHVTGLGTITTGVWAATDVAVAHGGTGASTLNNLITLGTHTTGDYAATITAGTGLTSTGATSGESIAHSLSVDASQTQITALGTIGTGVWAATKIAVAYGGTNATSFANKAVVITQDSGDDTLAAAAMTSSGGLLIGGASGPAVATLTAGDNVTITNADGAITIASEPAATETIEDIAGALVAAGTKTRIAVTYLDAESAISMVVDDDLGNYDNTTAGFITLSDIPDAVTTVQTISPESPATNTVTDVLLLKSQSSGTPAAGIGTGIAFSIETAAGNVETGARIEAVVTDPDATNEDIDVVVYTMVSGDTATESLRVKSSGDVTVAGSLTLGSSLSTSQGGTGAASLDNLIGIGQMAGIARGAFIVGDASGDPKVLSPGTENQVLTIDENGDTKWEDPTSGSTHHDHYTAGDGLVLTDAVFSTDLKANGGLVIESTKLAVDLGASSITGTLAVKDGGTGAVTLTDGGVLLGSGTGAVTVMAVLANGAIVIGDGAGDPVALSAFSSSTGTLKVANGGTGATTLNNLITLGTHTTGNYVATIADSGGGTITVANSGSETAAVTLDVADNSIDSVHYVDGSIDTVHVGNLQITTGKIAADAIDGTKLADNAVNSEHYTDGSIDLIHLSADSVDGTKIVDDAIDSEHYTDASIDFVHIQDIAANSILGRNAATAGVLSEIALTTTQLLIGDGTGFTAAALSGDVTMTNAGVVTIGDDKIDSQHYVDGSIDFVHIQDVAGNSILGRNAATAGVLSEIALTTTQILIGDGTGFTAAALSGDVTMTNAGVITIGNDKIDSQHYVDGSIDTAHIGNLQVTTAKIAADAIDGTKLADNAVDSEHYTDGSIDTAHIADNQVTLAKMAGITRGSIIIGNATGDPAALAIGSDTYVLTSDGTDIAWAAAGSGSGDITAVVAGTGLSGGATSGSATLNVEAAQSGITSLGTLTTLTVDNIIINGTTIGHTSDTDAIAISSGGNVTFSKATKPSLKANSDGVTVTFDVNEANVHTVTLGGNRTFAISNETAGQKFMIRVLQDGTGSRTLTWFSTIKWAGGSAPTLTTTANKADVFGFLVTGTDTYDGFVVGQDI